MAEKTRSKPQHPPLQHFTPSAKLLWPDSFRHWAAQEGWLVTRVPDGLRDIAPTDALQRVIDSAQCGEPHALRALEIQIDTWKRRARAAWEGQQLP